MKTRNIKLEFSRSTKRKKEKKKQEKWVEKSRKTEIKKPPKT
jgi:hypothetical protein